jgi:dipeptidyl aminopeptidase/acylaminoacyl peptidase
MRPIAILILAASLAAQTGDPAEVQLREAMHKEVVNGDLKGAIEIYRKIAERKNTSRSVAAKALLHMGQCQEKLGAADAHSTYDRLVRDFADQTESVSEARTRLAALGSQPVRASGVTVRHLWSGAALGPFHWDGWNPPVGISPDGRYLTYPQRNLMLRDLSNGQARTLTHNGSDKGSAPPREEGAEGSVFSPDGSQIAYCWITGHEEPDEELRVMKSDGTGMRVVYSQKRTAHLDPVAWSPDQKYILIFEEPHKESNQLVLVSTADGSSRSLKPVEPYTSGRASFSPDGRYIVFDRVPDHSGGELPFGAPRDLFVISVETSQETPLVQHPADDYVVGWTPDGSGVLFVSDRSVSGRAIWFQPVLQGKPQGEARFIREVAGLISPVG